MNKRKTLQKMICLILSAVTALGFFSGNLAMTAMASSSAVYTYHLPYWHPAGEYPGGWARHEGDAIYFFEISDMPGKIAYCMEPGRARADGAAANSQTPDQVFAGGNNVLTGEQIKNFIEILLNLGYKGSPANLTTANGVQDPADNLYYAVATQILLWEVIIGERDADFDYCNTGNVNLAELVLGPVNESTAPEVRAFHEGEDYWYRQIEAGVRNYLHNRVIPSFSYGTPQQAAAAVGDPRYLVDPASRSVVLTDTNGVLAQYPHLSFSVNGQPVNADYSLDAANNRVTIVFNDASIEVDDVLLTIRSDSASRRYALVYGDGRWGPDWAESDNWQEITTWGDEEYDYVYVRFTDDIGFSVTKVADSAGDNISGIAFNLWRYGDGRDSGFFNAGAGDVIVAAGYTDARGRLVWETADSTSLDLPAGNYGINEIYVPTYFRTLDGHDIQYPYEVPTDGTRTWSTRGNTMENHMFYTSFTLGGANDVNFVLHNRRSQGGFSLNKSINPLIPGFGFENMSFSLYYDTDNSGSYTDGDYLVANGWCDSSGKVLWNCEGYQNIYRFTGLPGGRYIIRETWNCEAYSVTNTTAGWVRINDHTYDLAITVSNGATPNYTVVNRPETGSVAAYKEVVNSSDLFNASSVHFALYRDDNGNGLPESNERIAEGTPSGSEGRVMWTGDTGGRAFTNADRVDLLRFGSYIIEENWAHTSFEVANTTEGWTRLAEGRYIRRFDIGAASRDVTFRVSNEARYAGVDVWKDIPAGDAFDISLVHFELINTDTGATIASGMPGADGHVQWDSYVAAGLPYGHYRITETWPSEAASCADGSTIPLQVTNETEGWIRSENNDGTVTYSITFTLESNVVLTFRALNNEHSNSFRVVKIPSVDGDECDIRFELYAAGGVLYAEGTAHSSGMAGTETPVSWQTPGGTSDVLERVPEGAYILREYVPSTSYISEAGEDTGIGYTYAVPEGFTRSDDGTYFYRTVNVRDGQNGTVTVRTVNVRHEASLEICKVSETGVIEGLSFAVAYRGNAAEFNAGTAPRTDLGVFETGADGRIVLQKLPTGWYEITETVPSYMICRWDDGSAGAVRRIWVDASSAGCVTVTAENVINAIIRVNKEDEWTGEAVGGAEFDLYADLNANGTIDDDELDTAVHCSDVDGDGVVYFPGISGGSYMIREVVTPEGYLLNDREFTVEVASPQIYDVTVEETPVTLNIRIYKIDDNDPMHLLAGAGFTLYADTNGNGEWDEDDLQAVAFDRDEGAAVPVNVIPAEEEDGTPYYTLDRQVREGTYFIVETQAPEGFVMNDTGCLRVELARGTEADPISLSFYITNSMNGGLRVIKIDEDYPESRLSGAVFTVYRDSDRDGSFDIEADTMIGDMNEVLPGEYLITGLAYGRYYVVESQAPEGYIRREDVWQMDVTSDSVIYEISDSDHRGIANSPFGSVTVIKYDEDFPDAALSGAEFTVYSAADGSVTGIMDDNNGVYSLGGLAAGDYYLEETRAPEGFIRDTNTYPFTIAPGARDVTVDNTAAVSRPVEGAFTNSAVRADIRINKNVAGGGSLEGFVFEIVRDGEVVATAITDADGVAVAPYLRFGTYTIREVESEATIGTYYLAEPVTVTIESDEHVNGTVIDVDISNALIPSPTPTPSAAPTATPTATPAPSATPTATVTPTVTPTEVPSVTPTATPSATPSPTPEVVRTPSTGEELVSIAKICGVLSVTAGMVLLIMIRRKGERDV